ncbi:hypothetical protein H4219_004603 [Mycoemilia scoparia]|uniref:Conserved oligomeric Golgi complex subunit 8 n=1 Tax=Mycoemilia scoparia TaxID=417184 RepID=A0A9W8DRL5_9FUNG|nr:hypothetical protein H4219_004603 [Mycoemilia scoparia]
MTNKNSIDLVRDIEVDLDSIYGSSYNFGNTQYDSNYLDQYATIYRDLLKPSSSKESGDEAEDESEPMFEDVEKRDTNIRYIKMLSSLSLGALRAEPKILANEITQISGQLSELLLGETMSQKHTKQPNTSGLRPNHVANGDKSGSSEKDKLPIFSVLYDSHDSIASSLDNLESKLDLASANLPSLEQAYMQLIDWTKEMDKSRILIQKVMDSHDSISRLLELPHIISTLINAQRYREAIAAIRHVKEFTIKSMSSDEAADDATTTTDKSGLKSQNKKSSEALKIIKALDNQMDLESKHMLISLCQDLISYVPTNVTSMSRNTMAYLKAKAHGSYLGYGRSRKSMTENGEERTPRQEAISNLVERVNILSSMEIFTQEELEAFYLLARWQGWKNKANSYHRMRSASIGSNSDNTPRLKRLGKSSSSTSLSSTANGSNNTTGYASEHEPQGQYVLPYLETFAEWIDELLVSYSQLFGKKSGEAGGNYKSPMLHNLTTYACQTASAYLQDSVSSTTQIPNLVFIWNSCHQHMPTLSKHKICFLKNTVVPYIEEKIIYHLLRPVTESSVNMCTELDKLLELVNSVSSTNDTNDNILNNEKKAKEALEPLAASDRSFLVMSTQVLESMTLEETLSKSVRISPVSLSHYPMLLALHQTFRDLLHNLRTIHKSASSDKQFISFNFDKFAQDKLPLNRTLALVITVSVQALLSRISEKLIAVSKAIASQAEKNEAENNGQESPKNCLAGIKAIELAVKENCAAFAFGLVRYLSESLEEGIVDPEDTNDRVSRVAKIGVDDTVEKLFGYIVKN